MSAREAPRDRSAARMSGAITTGGPLTGTHVPLPASTITYTPIQRRNASPFPPRTRLTDAAREKGRREAARILEDLDARRAGVQRARDTETRRARRGRGGTTGPLRGAVAHAHREDLDTAAMVAAYEAGHSTIAIARMYGCAVNTARLRLVNAGVTMRPAGPARVALLTEERLRELAGKGLSTAEIAGAANVGTDQVRSRAVQWGVTIVKGKSGRVRDDVSTAQVVAWRADGVAWAEISRRTGMTIAGLRNRMVRATA